MNRLAILLLLVCTTLHFTARAETAIEKEQLVGVWKYEEEEQKRTVQYDLRADGTFSVTLHQGGEFLRRIEGRWNVADNRLVTTYESDSQKQVMPGTETSDKLQRADSTSFTVESADGHHRTYWKATEK